MRSELIRGLSPEEVKERAAILKGGRPTREIYKQVLEGKYQQLIQKVLTEKNYTDVSWAAYQADMIGEARAIKYMLELLTLDQEEI